MEANAGPPAHIGYGNRKVISLYWISFSVLLYVWIGYVCLLLVRRRLFRLPFSGSAATPTVTVLVTVHNEEGSIARRIENILDSDYPKELMEVLVASDGSTDRTNAIVAQLSRQDTRIKLFEAQGGGKSKAQNMAIPLAGGSVIVLTDADALFDRGAIKRLVRHFADVSIGCVSGRVSLRDIHNAVAEGQGLYWQYEMLLRRLESDTGCLHTASGAIMAFRKDLFNHFPDIYGDDCILPLDIVRQGYRVVHENEAVAFDVFPSSVQGEFRARTRMTLRNITCTSSKCELLNPFKFGFVSIAILSHKVFRWLTPYFLIILLVSNVFLLGKGGLYVFTFAAQMLFYLLGFIGFAASWKNRRIPVASSVFSFILANIGFFWGVLKALMGQKQISYKNIKHLKRSDKHHG